MIGEPHRNKIGFNRDGSCSWRQTPLGQESQNVKDVFEKEIRPPEKHWNTEEVRELAPRLNTGMIAPWITGAADTVARLNLVTAGSVGLNDNAQ